MALIKITMALIMRRVQLVSLRWIQVLEALDSGK